MASYVIKSWRASDQPDVHRNYITIVGRKEGLLSWLLALFRIDPTATITVSDLRIEFSEASLAGSVRRLIPLPGVCSTVYGYHKPWKAALGLLVFFTWLVSVFSATRHDNFTPNGVLAGFAIGGLVALVYFFLNRTLTLGFVEHSGIVSCIQFKRSVIENQDINEAQAGYVCQLVQALIESRQKALSVN